MCNIVVALWTWGYLWQDKVVLVSCDNQSAVSICQTGRTRDHFLNTCLHALWLQGARYNIDLRVIHKPCKANEIADVFQGSGYEYWDAVTNDILHVTL